MMGVGNLLSNKPAQHVCLKTINNSEFISFINIGDTVLSGQLDFIQVDIHPSEQYKSVNSNCIHDGN